MSTWNDDPGRTAPVKAPGRAARLIVTATLAGWVGGLAVWFIWLAVRAGAT